MKVKSTSRSSFRLLRWLGLAAATTVFAMSAQAAGISSTKHNLSSSGGGVNKNSATDQICVFCHTPHGADTAAAAPLWNKKLPLASSYTLYSALNTSSLNGEILPVGSVSLACLSCHDGSQAMDNMVNAPGAGGYNAGGANFSNGTWTGANQTLGKINTTSVTNLGTDLRNDHPIGVAYCGGGLTGTGNTVSGTCADLDFINATATTTSDGRLNAQLQTASVNTNQVFWINVDGAANRSKNDISLYTRTFSGSIARPSVECGSCHDPHVESKAGNNMMFMRVSTAGSQICLSCHIK